MDVKSVNECEITGNTKSDFTINKQYINWCFTLNNYNDNDIEDLLEFMKKKCKKWIFQEEIGENGTPHLQGFISLNKVSRLTTLKKLNNRIHWEVARDPGAAFGYCKKEETRNGKRWSSEKIREPIKIIKEEQLFDWQKELIEILNGEVDDRKIYWYWSKNGGVGKTEFAIYLRVKMNALKVSGDARDMYMLIKNRYEEEDYPKIVIVDVARSRGNDIDYEGLENIKSGYICSTKYETVEIIGRKPHMVVFANKPPGNNKLSENRLIIKELT